MLSFVFLQELPYDEAAEAEESSEEEGEESMAAARFTESLQGGGSFESSSSHERHGIIGQINEVLTLKLSSCPHLDDELSLTYKHMDDLSREEISQLLGEARVQAKKCSQSKYCELPHGGARPVAGRRADAVVPGSRRGLARRRRRLGALQRLRLRPQLRPGRGHAPARTLKTFAHHLDSQNTQKKRS